MLKRLAFMFACLAASPQLLAGGIFLDIPGITGEAGPPHAGAIPCTTIGTQATRTLNAAPGSGGELGSLGFQIIRCVKPVDSSTVALTRQLLTGGIKETAKLSLYADAANTRLLMTIELGEVIVTEQTSAIAETASLPIETIGLSYERILITSFGASGTPTGGSCYDFMGPNGDCE